jgi:hypothetical protein
MEPDFMGWATKTGLKCSDGRTIMDGAFKHQDKMKVPLVWHHGGRQDPNNVLGHAILENRDGEGVYCYGFFNASPSAEQARGLLEHGDIEALSIWANELVERAGRVMHGAIREVSLVLSGANPGALIESVTIRHSDGDEEVLDDEAIIYSGEEIELAEISHEDGGNDGGDGGDGPTIEEVYNSMTDEQKQVVHFMVGEALGEGGGNLEQNNNDDGIEHQEGSDMSSTRNVFEKDADGKSGGGHSPERELLHENLSGIMAAAEKSKGSLKAAIEEWGLEHGINDIEVLFPEATQLTAAPEFFGRRTEWVNGVLSGAKKTPFARVKTATADLTYDEARAKGYIKGNMKKEEFFGTSRRETHPQTIYKKQKLDRDDIIDITDFDVVLWMKGEMRLMLDEEIARAIMIGDGREADDEDKIKEDRIRPIATDDDFYTIRVNVDLEDANSSFQEVVDAIVMARAAYRGTGTPTFYTTEYWIARALLLKDGLGRRIYNSLDQLASELRVDRIVPVEVFDTVDDLIGIIVNMADYNIGADKGGQVAMFDDFDIDYNQYKYLIETRISGALIRPKSAFAIFKTAGDYTLLAPPVEPTFDAETGVVTLPTSTNYVWNVQDEDGDLTPVSDGAQTALDDGESVTYVAVASSGYYFATSEGTEFTFRRP